MQTSGLNRFLRVIKSRSFPIVFKVYLKCPLNTLLFIVTLRNLHLTQHTFIVLTEYFKHEMTRNKILFIKQYLNDN